MSKKGLIKIMAAVLIGSSIATVGRLTISTKVNAAAANTNVSEKKGRIYGKRSDLMKTKLDELVKSGTITQTEEDQIIAYMKQKHDARKAEMDKIKNMSEADRKAYMKNNKPIERSDMFKDLVDQKIITQAQADSIKAAMPQHPGK